MTAAHADMPGSQQVMHIGGLVLEVEAGAVLGATIEVVRDAPGESVSRREIDQVVLVDPEGIRVVPGVHDVAMLAARRASTRARYNERRCDSLTPTARRTDGSIANGSWSI